MDRLVKMLLIVIFVLFWKLKSKIVNLIQIIFAFSVKEYWQSVQK